MKPLVITCFAASLLTISLPSFSFADIAPSPIDSKPSKGPKSHALMVLIEPDAKMATLRIPRHFLDDQTDADRGTSGLMNPGRTVVAGVMLSAAAVGLLLVWRKRPARVLVAVMLGLAVLGTASLTLANRAPQWLREPKTAGVGSPASQVVLEIGDKGNAIVLILPPSILPKDPAGAETGNSPNRSK